MDATIKKIIADLKKSDSISDAIVIRALKTIDAEITSEREVGKTVDVVAVIEQMIGCLQTVKQQVAAAIQMGEAKTIDPFPHLSQKVTALDIKRIYRYLKPVHEEMYARVVVRVGGRGRIRPFSIEQRVHAGPETDYNLIANVDIWTAYAVLNMFGGDSESIEAAMMPLCADPDLAEKARRIQIWAQRSDVGTITGSKSEPASPARKRSARTAA